MTEIRPPAGFSLDQPQQSVRPPPGFTLDMEPPEAAQPAAPKPPAGFTLDAPESDPVATPALETAWGDRPVSEKILNPLKAGTISLGQGTAALGTDLSARSLDVMDRIDRGEAVPDMDDPVGYQHMDPQQRAEAWRQAEADIGRSARMVVERGRQAAAIPQNPAAQQMLGAKTWGEAGEAFWSDPLGVVTSVGLQSLPSTVPALAAGAVGGPVVGGIVMGASSAGTEFMSSVIDGLAQEGVDTSDEAALTAAFWNPELMQRVRSRAATRAAIVGGTDAATMGLAGRTLAPQAITSRVAREAVSIPAQVAAQGVAGGAAEAGAQLATEGSVTEPGQVLAEVAGEAFGAPGEVLSVRGGEAVRAGVDNPAVSVDVPTPPVDTLAAPSNQPAEINTPPQPDLRAELDQVLSTDRPVEEIVAEADGVPASSASTDMGNPKSSPSAAEPAPQPPAGSFLDSLDQPLEDLPDDIPFLEYQVAEAPAGEPSTIGPEVAHPPAQDFSAASALVGESAVAVPELVQSFAVGDLVALPDGAEGTLVEHFDAGGVPSVRVIDDEGRTAFEGPAAAISRAPPVAAFRRGTRSAPITAQTGDDIALAGRQAATSPENDRPEPTEAQRSAGNYAKGHLRLHGLEIAVENPAGSTRSGTDSNGQPWSVTLPASYGYVKGSKGADGDHVDVYVGPQPQAGQVYVVDQIDPATGKFDEHKTLMGFSSEQEAMAAYDGGFSDGRGPDRRGAVTTMTVAQFRSWVRNGRQTKKPLRYAPGTWRTAITRAVVAESAPINEAIRQRLAKAIEDVVIRTTGEANRIRVHDHLYGYGEPVPAAIVSRIMHFAALDVNGQLRPAEGLQASARHEVIHFLRESGVIGPAEWRALFERAPGWRHRYDINRRYAGLGLSEQQLNEEAIAEAYADWGQGNLQAGGLVGRAFAIIKRFMDQVRQAFGRITGRELDARDVFAMIEGGQMARREQRVESGREAAAFQARYDAVATRLTGNELGPALDLPSLRRAARAFLRGLAERQEAITNAQTGMVIRFDRSSFEKAPAQIGSDLLRLVPAVPDMLRQGSLLSTESGNRPGIIRTNVFTSAAELAGRRIDTILYVHEKNTGERFYSLHQDRGTVGRLGASPDVASGEAVDPLGVGDRPATDNVGREEPDGNDGAKFQKPHSRRQTNRYAELLSAPKLEKSTDIGLFARLVLHPYHIAQTEHDFAPVFDRSMEMLQRRHRSASLLAETMQPYFQGSAADKAAVNKVLEFGRTTGADFAGEQIIKAKNTAVPGLLLGVDEEVTLTDQQATMYRAVRKGMDQALLMFKNQFLIESGYGKPGDPQTAKAIRESLPPDASERDRERITRVAETIEAIERARRAGYVPFSRFGDYTLTVRDKLGAVAHFEKLERTKGEPMRLFELRAEKRRREVVARYPKDSGFDVGKVQYRPRSPIQDFGDVDFAALENLLEQGGADRGTREAAMDALQAAFTASGFRSHFIKSKDTPGWSKDFERSLSDYIVGVSGYLARRSTLPGIDAAIQAIPSTKPALKGYAGKYRDYVVSPQEEAHAWRQWMFFAHLAGNLSSAMINLAQVPMVTAPYLTMFASRARVAGQLTRAAAETLAMFRPQARADFLGFDIDAAPEDVRAELKRLSDEGELGAQATLDQMGVAHGRGRMLRGLSKGSKAVLELTGSMFSAAERFNRIATAIATIRLTRRPEGRARANETLASSELRRIKQATGPLQPVDLARAVIQETHGVAGKGNRPTMMRGPVGATVFQFKGFLTSMLSLQWRLATRHGAAGKTAFALNMAALAAAGGLLGLPGADDLKELIELLHQFMASRDLDIEKEIQTSVTDLLGEVVGENGAALVAEAMRRGLFRSAGVDVSQRLGMGQALPLDTLRAALGDGDVKGDRAFSDLGLPFGVAKKLFDVAAHLRDGEAWSALAVAAPFMLSAGAGNAMKSYAMAQEGQRSADLERMQIERGELTSADIALRAAGFQSSHISREFEKQRSQRRAGQSVQELQNSYSRRLAQASIKGEPVQPIIDEILAYNEGRPDFEKIVVTRQAVSRAAQREALGMDATRGPRKARGEHERIEEAWPQ